MKMLIPLDASEFAEEVLEPAAKLAEGVGADVYLIEVVNESRAHDRWATHPSSGSHTEYNETGWAARWGEGGSVDVGFVAETKGQAMERLEHEADDNLHRTATHFFGAAARTETIVGHDPAQDIIAYVRREGIDVIAMATHGRTGLAKMLMGSVADKLLRSSVVPLILVRPDQLHHRED